MTSVARWGILGSGFIASMFARDLAFTSEAEVSAIGSRDLSKARKFAIQHNIANAHGSYQELIDDPAVDLVYVAVPHSEHERLATLAVLAGKPVLVEKPFALNAKQTERVFRLAQEREVFVMEAMWSRFLPHMIEARRVVESGRIGEVVSVVADIGLRFDPTDLSHRLYDPELGGGALLDLGVYAVSLALSFLGDKIDVAALGTRTDTGVDAAVSVALRDEYGRQGSLHTTLSSETPKRASINGTKGRIEFGHNYSTPTNLTIIDFGAGNPARGESCETFDGSIEGGLGWRLQALEVARCVAADLLESPIVPHSLTLKTMRVMDEIRRQVGVRYPGDSTSD